MPAELRGRPGGGSGSSVKNKGDKQEWIIKTEVEDQSGAQYHILGNAEESIGAVYQLWVGVEHIFEVVQGGDQQKITGNKIHQKIQGYGGGGSVS